MNRAFVSSAAPKPGEHPHRPEPAAIAGRVDAPGERRLARQPDVAQRVELVPAAGFATQGFAAMVDRRRAASAGGLIGVRLPRPRPVEPIDLGVADRAEPWPAFGCAFERGTQAFRLPGPTACRPGHGATLARGRGATRWGQMTGGGEAEDVGVGGGSGGGGPVREATGSLTAVFGRRRPRTNRTISMTVRIGSRRRGRTRNKRARASQRIMPSVCTRSGHALRAMWPGAFRLSCVPGPDRRLSCSKRPGT